MADDDMVDVFAYFQGGPGDPLDKACRSIFESQPGAISIGAGTDLISGERDVQYRVPRARVEALRAKLKAAGFRLAPAP
jgi:hypothetical protein